MSLTRPVLSTLALSGALALAGCAAPYASSGPSPHDGTSPYGPAFGQDAYPSHAQYDPQWQTLIDGGRGLENFVTVGTANWRPDGDGIVADGRSGTDPNYFLATRSQYKDFELYAEFWVSADANSGIFVRCADSRAMSDRTCHEANIWDRRSDWIYATGAIVGLTKAPTPQPRTGGQWNTIHITAKGSYMRVVLNGQRVAETYQARDSAGVIGLQYAGGVVKFRKVQIRPI